MAIVSHDSEFWIPVPGFGDKYEASSKGRLRQVKGRGCSIFRPRYIRSEPGKSLYAHLSVTVNGVTRSYTVHQLIALAFLGPCPDGMEINHVDLNKANNRPDNLEYVTHQVNIRHARAHKQWRTGGKPKLDEGKVRAIRQDTRPQRVIAREYKISTAVVCKIRRREIWRHVED